MPEPTEPSQTWEVEVTFDVDERTAAPDWRVLPGVASVDAPEQRELDARYFDTEDYVLGRAHYALRRREGGPDEGWHLKGPRQGAARLETGWALGDEFDEEDPVPGRIRTAITDLTDRPLGEIARIRNSRTAVVLRDAQGGVIAEFVDDRVRAVDVRHGTERTWREWEIELGPAAPRDHGRFFAAVRELCFDAGACDALTDSKLARALGL
ncbi:hypothetical protein GCM10009808_10820 [Microbacterium sediminicola]|uniref:CYTH domain-containing protein n=1 Tax=Microbacterium sediminicola TaxID=415210 RepID=A0ABP4TZ86_9MICO